MTLVRSTGARNRRSVSSAAAKHVKKYKIEYKLVTEEKKKLIIVRLRPRFAFSVTFDHLLTVIQANGAPPRDYVFIATGCEEFTNFCRERSQKLGQPVYVSNGYDPTKPARANDPHNVGFHIDRDGFYFARETVDKARDWLGYEVDRSGKPFKPNHELAQSLKRHNQPDEMAQINAAVRELFPKMPEKTAKKIVKHAFGKVSRFLTARFPMQPPSTDTVQGKGKNGKQRVGNAAGRSLASRVQLAVNAHIRHVFTDYDRLLKNGTEWVIARAAIQQQCIKKLKEWRGEDGKREQEEIFQEWIDLRDDDDDDENDVFDSESPYEPDSRPQTTMGSTSECYTNPKALIIAQFLPSKAAARRFQRGGC